MAREEHQLINGMYFVLFVVEGEKVTMRTFWGYDIKDEKVMDRPTARKEWKKLIAQGFVDIIKNKVEHF